MRKIESLTQEEKKTLEEAYRNSPKAHFRNRCHSILLSFENYTVSEITRLYNVRTRTIYTWFNRWNKQGIMGLMIFKGRGIKAKLDSLSQDEIIQVKQVVKANSQSLRNICETLSNLLGFPVTKYMLKRLLKKNLTTLGDGFESA